MADDAVAVVDEQPQVAETPVQEPSAPKTIREHWEAAKVAQSKDQEPTETKAVEATPPAEQTETDDQPPETVITEDTLLTPQEIAALPKELKAQYKSLEKAFTTKTQAIAAERKAFQPWNNLVEALKDPARVKDTVQQLAQQVGLIQPTTVEKETVKQNVNELLAGLPKEYEFLAPVLEVFGNNLLKVQNSKLDPIAKTQNEIISANIANSTEATLEAFEAKYPGWGKHEPAMLDVMKRLTPAPDMTDIEYMEMAYKLATYGQQSVNQTKKIVERMTQAAKSAETVTTGVTPERIEHPLPPVGRRSLKDAYEAAKRGERWTT